MIFSPVFEKKASEEVQRYYADLKDAFGIKKLPLVFYISGNFPEFLGLITPQILANLKNPDFGKLVSEVNYCLLELFRDYKIRKDFDTVFKESARVYKSEIDSLLKINIKTLIFLYAIRESVKGMVFGAKKLPYSFHNFSKDEAFEGRRIEKGDPGRWSGLVEKGLLFGEKDLALDTKDIEVSKKSRQLVLSFYRFLKKTEAFFKDEMEKNEFVFYRLGIERLFLSFLDLLPEVIDIDYKILYQSIRKYKNYQQFIAILVEDFPVIYVHKIFLLLLLKKLSLG